MNAPSVDIKDLLASDSSVGLTYGTDLFVSEMPNAPDECVAIVDSPGEAPEPDYVYLRPHVQVRIRGARGGFLSAYSLAESCRDSLHGTADETVNSTRYVGIWALGDIMQVGYDDERRPILSVNFRIHRTST